MAVWTQWNQGYNCHQELIIRGVSGESYAWKFITKLIAHTIMCILYRAIFTVRYIIILFPSVLLSSRQSNCLLPDCREGGGGGGYLGHYFADQKLLMTDHFCWLSDKMTQQVTQTKNKAGDNGHHFLSPLVIKLSPLISHFDFWSDKMTWKIILSPGCRTGTCITWNDEVRGPGVTSTCYYRYISCWILPHISHSPSQWVLCSRHRKMHM